MGPDHVYVPIPDGLAVSGHPVLEGRWALDHVAPSDRAILTAAWRNRGDTGDVEVHVELVNGERATLWAFNVVGSHGVTVVVAVGEDGADLNAALGGAAPAIAPRFCRMRRDIAGRVLDADEVAAQVLGWPGADLSEREEPLSFIHPDDHSTVLDHWMATLADPRTGQRCRVRSVRADGTWMWIELTSYSHLDDPDDACVVSEVLDVSEEMAAHEEVRLREQLLQRLAGALPVGVLQLDMHRRIIYRNDRLSEILGQDEAASADEQFASVSAEDLAVLDASLSAALERGEDGDVTIRVDAGRRGTDRIARVITRALIDDGCELSGVIACVTDVTEVTLQRRELERQATFDTLTGCHNRSSVLGRLSDALRPGPVPKRIAAIFVDLDNFKAVNDGLGHAVGDEVLRASADVLRSVIREGDSVGRLGGDEFLVVCHDVRGPQQAMELATRIVDRLRLAQPIGIKASVGVTWTGGGMLSPDRIVALADEAMYESKREGLSQPHMALAG